MSKQGNGFLKMLLLEAAQSEPGWTRSFTNTMFNKPKAVAKVAAARRFGRAALLEKAVLIESGSGCPWSAKARPQR
jgi:hypothetical protein